MIHSPCDIDYTLKTEIQYLGPVAFIVAPGTYHHLYVQSCQKAFPDAKTYLCPGIEEKRPDIAFDGILNDTPEPAWEADLDQVLLKGNRIIWEVAIFHRSSSTLILVDLLENIGDDTPGTNWVLRFWWKYVLFMWNNAKPAPEYQLGWKKDKSEARDCMKVMLEWEFDKVIIAHGNNIEQDAKEVVRKAWNRILV